MKMNTNSNLLENLTAGELKGLIQYYGRLEDYRSYERYEMEVNQFLSWRSVNIDLEEK